MSNVSLSFLGDIAFFNKNYKNSYSYFNKNNYKDIIANDILIGNFEFPLSSRKKKYFSYSHEEYLAPIESMDVIKQFNFDILSFANNHILDWGIEGIESTKEILNSLGIKTLGAGRNDKVARNPIILSKNNIQFGFLAYCKEGEHSATDKKPGTALLEVKKIKDDIFLLKKSVNHIILLLHWGVEFSDYPYPADVKIAHQLIDAGATCIIGHHPHVVQGIEVYKNKPIFYSLGSFIYNPYYETNFVNNKIEERLESMAVVIKFNKENIVEWQILPFRNSGDTIFPEKLIGENRAQFYSRFNLLSARINDVQSWFYQDAFKNISKRESSTILRLIISSVR